MISITCTQCQTLLTIDDAFAGGVCRCQHCGTIQTVPSAAKFNASGGSYVSPSATTSKALYQNQNASRAGNVAATTPSTTSPSGLDELAQVVGSAGLSGSGLRSSSLSGSGPVASTQVPPTPAAKLVKTAKFVSAPVVETDAPAKSKMPLAIGGGVVLLAIVGAIIFFVVHGHKDTPAANPETTAGQTVGTDANGVPTAPSFCGTALPGDSVVYIIDPSSLKDDFETAKAAVFQSILSLGPDKNFAVMLFNSGGDDFIFPPTGLRLANQSQKQNLENELANQQASGASTIAGALQTAIDRHPATIVIITAKYKFNDADARAIGMASSSPKARYFAFIVKSPSENVALRKLATASGGAYRELSAGDLK